MKLNKKFLSCLTAVTVAMAPMTAFANVTPYDITGTGSVTYLDTEIYNVVLPTSESIDFTVDPYGITDPNFVNGSQSLESIVSGAAGTVTSSATAVINKSSVDLDVKIQLLFDDAVASNSAVKLATTKAEAETGDKDLYLTVQHLSGATLGTVVTAGSVTLTGSAVSADAFTLSTAALDITNWNVVTNGATTVVTATGSALLASADAIEFTLDDVADAYFVSGGVATLDESQVTYNSDNVYAFAITGYAKPSASVWEDIANAGGELKLTMKFTIDKADDVKTSTTVDFNGGNFDIIICKNDVTAAPASLYLQSASKWFNMSSYSTINIQETADAYVISVTGYPTTLADGTYPINVCDASGNVLHSLTMTK